MRWAGAILVALLLLPSTATAQTANRILVMPFENIARNPKLVWLGEAAAVLLTDNLNARGARAITREERREAFAYLQIPMTASLSDATMIRVGQLVGASRLVLGALRLEGETLVVRSRVITLESARVETSSTEFAPMSDLFAVLQRTAERLSPGGVPSTGATRPAPSLTVFENYVKGLLAETPATGLSYLNAALQQQPTFDRARLAIWEIYDEQGEHERALAAVNQVAPDSDVFRRARFMAGLSQLSLKQLDAAFQSFKLLLDSKPTAALLNNIGVVQTRRQGPPQNGLPEFYFTRAAELDGTDADYFFNLGYAYWTQRDYPAAAYWLREAVRRNPTDGDAHYILGAALTATGNPTEATREKELARRLSSTYAEWERRPANEVVPRGLARVKGDPDLLRVDRIEASLMSTGLRDQQELARFYLDRGRRLVEQERDRDAISELNRAVFLSPYEAEAHLLIGRVHLRGGRRREAIDALKISIWSHETVEAHIALAEAYLDDDRLDDAKSEARRAAAMDPTSAAAAALMQKLNAR